MTSAPKICGFFSIKGGEYEDSTTSLRYYNEPEIPINLNTGIEDLPDIPNAFYERKLNRLLTFLVNHKREYLNTPDSAQDDDKLIPSTLYISSRGVLQKILCSPINPWTILATKYKGNIYLCKYEKRQPENENQIKLSNYGRMFERHCLSEHPNVKPDRSQISEESNQFYCVFKRNLINRQFLFSADMDATNSKTPLNSENPKQWKPNQFVELKITTKKYSFEKFKVHAIWAQSYISGVENVHIGFRDDMGIVKELRCYSIDELKQISNRNWRASMTSLEYINYILDKFETDLRDIDCPHTTIKYDYDYRNRTKSLSSTKHNGKSDYSFLPAWYLEEMKYD